ncbi:MAG: 23S rRNA (cytosine(1962)-C(5))-methyltransferase RlmI, partial [bacterium]|nr:23S rRNA (cytosine(1962)-C(5))-methyltransferase RlmI [bacterium]
MVDRASVVVRTGRERSIGLGHPWILSGSVERVEGQPAAGDLVRVLDAQGRVLGHGDYDPNSQIRVRVLAFGESRKLDEDLDEKWLLQ